jgi:homoserine kinase
MITKSVKVFAPATIANVGPGFDVLGIAIEQLGDIVTAERCPEKGLFFSLHESSTIVPANKLNVAAHVANLLLEEHQPPFGIKMTLHKKMPIGSGLGSSGASCAAAAAAVNALLLKPLPTIELVRFAMAGEKLASNAAHADNVAPSLLGGACLIQSYDPLHIIQLPIKNNFFWVVAHPHLIIETKKARDLLPAFIPLATTIKQSGNLAGLIVGLMQGNADFIQKSLIDYIAEPLRSALIPNFYAVKEAALAAGALGFSISGSGPSVFAVTTSLPIAEEVAKNIKHAFLSTENIICDIYISRINEQGTQIMEQSS